MTSIRLVASAPGIPAPTPGGMTSHPGVVLSYGMGADSTALLLRWMLDPASRPCDLRDLLAVTAQTGDEWPVTGELVTRHMLPLLRRHHIRWVQVARAGPRQADGITVLADTRAPTTVHLAGDYRLSQELLAAGTVPQTGGARRCSLKAKGWPLDEFIATATGGQPYLHAIGFSVGELARAARDARYNTPARTGWYPLIGWGWDRAAAERYIHHTLGVTWPKSCCTYCPFALANRAGRTRVIDAFRDDPHAGITGLIMEHLAVSLNPRQGLMAGERLADLLAAAGLDHTLALFHRELTQVEWRVYEVRRALLPGGRGRAVRWLRAHAAGTRTQMAAELARIAATDGLCISADDGIERAWVRRRGAHVPTAEWFYTAAPAGATDKEGPGFAAAWPAALAGPAQGELFTPAVA